MANSDNYKVHTHSKTIAPNNGPVSIVYSVEDADGVIIKSYEGKTWPTFTDFQNDILNTNDKADNAFRVVYGEVFVNDVFSQTKWNQLGASMKVLENASKVN